jgi:hypothetical protein
VSVERVAELLRTPSEFAADEARRALLQAAAREAAAARVQLDLEARGATGAGLPCLPLSLSGRPHPAQRSPAVSAASGARYRQAEPRRAAGCAAQQPSQQQQQQQQ